MPGLACGCNPDEAAESREPRGALARLMQAADRLSIAPG
jgi:hypothetical protein